MFRHPTPDDCAHENGHGDEGVECGVPHNGHCDCDAAEHRTKCHRCRAPRAEGDCMEELVSALTKRCPDLRDVVPHKTRRFSHVVYEGFGSRMALPAKAAAAMGRNALFFLLCVVATLLFVHAFGGSGACGTGHDPVTPGAPTVVGDEGGRKVLFYNVGWKGGPIELATADSRFKPKGQHIMLDVHDSDPQFLNDMEGMTSAFRELLRDAGMHILSSSSHQLAPQGVSITITIEESHLTVHTWPEHRAALVDVFTCGSTELLPILPKLVAAFRTTEDKVRWSLHFRGEIKTTDLQETVLKNRWASKRNVHRAVSPAGQQVEVWHRAVPYGSHAGHHVDEATALFVDGSLQATTADEHVYYESLVHPGFVAHESGPSRVAVVSGDSVGATREVLRHRSVGRVDVIVSDAGVTAAARTHMPQLDNCSFAGAGRRCWSDSRVSVLESDPVDTLRAACGEGGAPAPGGGYDAVVVDLLDPDHHPTTPFQRLDALLDAALCALGPGGVLVGQIGAPPTPEGRLRRRTSANLNVITHLLRRFRAERVFVYDVFVPSFREERSFVCVCRSAACAARWRASAARVDDAVAERVLSPGSAPLRFFSGSVMAHLREPSMPWHDLVAAAAAVGDAARR